MRILALYRTPTLSLVRRIQAPFSVLARRNYGFSFQRVEKFSPDFATSFNVTILPNWILSDEEVESLRSRSTQNVFVYDLSDPELLQQTNVQETLRICRMVTVPNERLAREVRFLLHNDRKVKVLPSVVDTQYFLQGSQPRPQDAPLTIGCFGPFDWSLCEGALRAIKETHPKVVLVGNAEVEDLIDLPCDVEPNMYPTRLRQCHIGLLPQEQETGRDLIWRHEYGIFGIPCLDLPVPPRAMAQGDREQRNEMIKEQWVKAIKKLLFDVKVRSEGGQYAFDLAQKHKSTRLADQYLRTYNEMLPHFLSVR